GSIKKSRPLTVFELAPGLGADGGGILAFAGAGDVMRGATVWACNQSAKLHGVSGQGRVAGDRGLAGTIKFAQEGALAHDGSRRIAVIKPGKNITHTVVVLACFNADCPLPYCRQKFLRAHDCSGVIGKTETLKAGECEYRGINVTGINFAQSRFDIAAQRQHAKIRTRSFGDRLPSQRSRADACAAGQLRQRTRWATDGA